MRYFLTAASQTQKVAQFRFMAVGYLDDAQFMRFHSNRKNVTFEPRTLWMEQEGPQYWEREMKNLKTMSRLSE